MKKLSAANRNLLVAPFKRLGMNVFEVKLTMRFATDASFEEAHRSIEKISSSLGLSTIDGAAHFQRLPGWLEMNTLFLEESLLAEPVRDAVRKAAWKASR